MAGLSIRPKARHGEERDSDSFVLIPPESYLNAVRKTLRIIDLDPCSSSKAQQMIDALGWYRAEDAMASLAEPWTGKVFLHTHWHHRVARSQVQKLLRDYLADRVDAAIILAFKYDLLRCEPLLLSFPFLLHYRRMPHWRWMGDVRGLERINPSFNSFTLFLPHKDGRHFDDERIAVFSESFAMFGRTIIAEDLGDDWQQQALLATQRMPTKPVLTVSSIDRYSQLPDNFGVPQQQQEVPAVDWTHPDFDYGEQDDDEDDDEEAQADA